MHASRFARAVRVLLALLQAARRFAPAHRRGASEAPGCARDATAHTSADPGTDAVMPMACSLDMLAMASARRVGP